MVYLITFFWGLASTLIPIFNAEAWVVGNVLMGSDPFLLALLISLAQCTAYTVYYYGGDAIVRRFPRVRKKLESFDGERYRNAGFAVLIVASTIGVPPLVFLAFLAPSLGFRFVPFIMLSFCGRLVRFLALALAPETFRGLFGAITK